MCEINMIYGLKQNIGEDQIVELTDMLIRSAISNVDGFGIFNDKATILKSAEAFDDTKHSSKLPIFIDSKFIITHNRLATTGKVEMKNTHPFEVNSFIFVHNGQISNNEELRREYDIQDKSECDSVVIGHLLHHYNEKYHSLIRAIKESVKHIDGWYSVFVFDKATQKLLYFKHNGKFIFKLASINKMPYIFGATDEENIVCREWKELYGFVKSKNQIIATLEPCDDTIYQINDKGIHAVSTFNPFKEPEKPMKTRITEAIETIEEYYPKIQISFHKSGLLQISKCDKFFKEYKGHFIKVNYLTKKGTMKQKTLVKIAKGIELTNTQTSNVNKFSGVPKQWREGCYEYPDYPDQRYY